MVCAMANSSFNIQPNTHTLIALISVVLSSIVVGVTIISSSPTRQNIARITKKKINIQREMDGNAFPRRSRLLAYSKLSTIHVTTQ